MLSMRSDAVIRSSLEPALVFALALAQLPLITAGLGLDGTSPLLLTSALVAALGFALAASVASRHRQRLAHMVLYMLLFGNLGMLIGASMDFGDSALVGLTHWCHMHAGLDLATIAGKLSGAPWSYGLMLAGCNLGMLLSDLTWDRRDTAADRAVSHHTHLGTLRCYLGCNLGMLAGMLLAEAMMPGGHHHHHIAVSGVLTMVAIMAAGMTVGMLIGLRLSFGPPFVGRGRVATG